MTGRFSGMRIIVAVCLLIGLGLVAAPARAQLRIDINRGVVEPLPITVVPFQGSTPDTAKIGSDVAGVIMADLEHSGLFRNAGMGGIEPASVNPDDFPKFDEWRLIKTQALVVGRAARTDDGKLRIEFHLWDIFAQQHMVGNAYTTTPGNWRRIAHIIADAIYKRITGEDGYFDTRIVYVAESGPQTHRVKRLAMMDQDGANHTFLTDGSSLVLTPRFSPSLQEIAYLRFANGQPRVFVRDLDTGREEGVGEFQGMTFAPRFSPDGDRLIMSMSKEGNSEIYSVDLRTRARVRLTNSPAIDTSPSYSPNGRQIVFNSDRGGSQQIYVMDADGSNVHRISFGDGRYATPVWSPRGDYIAFTKITGGQFAIGIMRPDGSGERILTRGFHVEGPTWAPNGRVLMFFRKEPYESDDRGGRSRLFTIDVTGANEREIITPLDASDPAWSPLHQ